MADCVVGVLECVVPLPPFCHNDSYLDELGPTVLSMNCPGESELADFINANQIGICVGKWQYEWTMQEGP